MNILVAIVLCGIVYVLWQGIQSGAPRADRGPVTAVYGILLILVVWVGLAWAAWLYSGLLATAILLAPPVLLWIFSGRRSIPTSWGARGRAVVPTAPSERKLDVGRCFSSTYGLARGRFRKLAQRRKAEMFTLAIPEIGPEGEKLTTDIAWLGGQKPVNVLLHLSGMAG